jgi:hypothetical protein
MSTSDVGVPCAMGVGVGLESEHAAMKMAAMAIPARTLVRSFCVITRSLVMLLPQRQIVS